MFFLVSNKPEDNVLINISSEIISTGLRKLFSVISKEQLYKEVYLRNGMFVYNLLSSVVYIMIMVCYGVVYYG